MQGSDKTELEVHGSAAAGLKVKSSYKFSWEVHSSAITGGSQCQNMVKGKP